MDRKRLETDLAYWNEMDPTGGEATHCDPLRLFPWLREDPLGFFVDQGVWGTYDAEKGEQHISEAIPKPVEARVAWDGVEWPIPVGQWAIAPAGYASAQEVQIVNHVRAGDRTEVIAQGKDNWSFYSSPEEFTPFPDVEAERARQVVEEELEQWFENAVQPFKSFHDEVGEADLARQVIEDADFFKEVLGKL